VRVRIDLHTHSTASDGTLAPAGLIRAAAATGLMVLAPLASSKAVEYKLPVRSVIVNQ
jgi:hypothetical protein